MDAVEAMIYCLGFVDDKAEDGDYKSQTAYDTNGDAHWFAWRVAHGQNASPQVCSESPTPFAASLQPYRLSR